MKKIIISTYDTINNPYYAGGGARAIHSIAKRLVKDYDVTVLYGSFKNAKNEKIDNVNYEKIGLNFLGPFLGQILFLLLLPFYVLLKRNSFDIWIESFTPPYSTAFTTLFTKKPIIGLCFQLNGIEMQKKYKIPFNLIESVGLKRYKNIICINKNIQSKISKINKNATVKMIPCGIDKELLNNNLIKEEKILLYVGRIDIYHKGIDLLIEAYKQIASKISYNLSIAGSGSKEQLQKLNKLIVDSGLQDRILVLGKISEETKKLLFQQSILFLVPSRFEGFGIVALESFAMNTPVLSFDIEGFDWIENKSSIKIPKYDIKKYADEILSLCNDKARRNLISSNARKLVNNFTWDEIVDDYKKNIEQIINEYRK